MILQKPHSISRFHLEFFCPEQMHKVKVYVYQLRLRLITPLQTLVEIFYKGNL